MRILQPDPVDDALRHHRRPAGRASTRAVARWLEMFSDESLELCDGDEPLPHGVLTVLTAGTRRRSIVEMLTPSASAACLRL